MQYQSKNRLNICTRDTKPDILNAMETPKKQLKPLKKLIKKVASEPSNLSVITETEQRKPLPHAFKPGQSGNPNGRPPGKRGWAVQLRELLQKTVDPATGRDMEQQVLHSLMSMMQKGHVGVITLLWEHIDGKPNQPMDVRLSDDNLSPEERTALMDLLQRNLPK